MSCKETILHNLNENDANKLKVALYEHKIESDKVREGDKWSVKVGSADFEKALSILSRSKLMRSSNVVSKIEEGFVPTKEERQRKIERELEEKIADTLMRLEGVEDVRIHLRYSSENYEHGSFSLEDQNKHRKGTASIMIIGEIKDYHDNVKKLINGATGIPDEDIQVIIFEKEKPINQDIVLTQNLEDQIKISFVNSRIVIITSAFIILLFLLYKRFRSHDDGLLRPNDKAACLGA